MKGIMRCACISSVKKVGVPVDFISKAASEIGCLFIIRE